MNLLYRTSPTLGARLLLGAMAVLLVGFLDQGYPAARADHKRPGIKAPPPVPKNNPVHRTPAPAQANHPATQPHAAGEHHSHKQHEAKAAPVLPKRHDHAGKHPPILAAMRDLEDAFAILERHADPLLGLYRIGAMERIQQAYGHLNLGVSGDVGRNQPETTPLRGLPAGSDFPHIRSVLGKVRDAQDKLKEVTLNLNGQRRAAIIKLNLAVNDLDLAMRHARNLGE